MESRHRTAPGFLLTISIFLALAACSPIRSAPLPATATDAPVPSPTATIQWFPATATLTPQPILIPSATPIYLPGVGDEIFTDNFSSPALWNTASSDAGSVSISRERITIAVKAPQTTLFSLRSEPLLGNFYAEISAHPALCRGGDSYGLLFRANGLDAYRYALSCNGTVRLEVKRAYNRPRVLAGPSPSGDVPPGSPGDVRLGVWAVGGELRFFLNGRHQFTITDPSLGAGTLGVFVESAKASSAATVTFSDLVVQSVSYISPTPTITPSKTPIPTSTVSQ
jgi:hypothetical protein